MKTRYHWLTSNIGSNLDKGVCIKWIGETYLEATAPTEKRAIGRSEFLTSWKDLLPETWRKEASLSSLTVRLNINYFEWLLN